MSWDNAGGDATGDWDAGYSTTWDAGNSGEAAALNGGVDTFADGDKPTENDTNGRTDRTPGSEERFDCGEEEHSKADCPNPRVFKGTCRTYEKEELPAAACPEKPPMLCNNCKTEGHAAKDCKENRVMDLSKIPDEQPEIAWQKVVDADGEKDLDDLREALKMYCKAVPDTTWSQLEVAFRNFKFNTFLIAREKELFVTQTIVNLQGKPDCKFEVGFYFSDKPRRAILTQGWPSSPAENMARLEDAGVTMDRGIPKCRRCNVLGHIARDCNEEVGEIARTEVKCVNCDTTGHRARDCPEPRKDRYACRNCKQSGHQANECTEPRSAEGVECKRCSEIGHFAKDCPTGGSQACRNCGEEGHKAMDCPKPRDPANATCRNCDTVGHFSKDCPEKKDWSRVKCNRCNEMGHTVRRCPQPDPDAADANGEVVESAIEVEAVAPQGDWETAQPAAASGDTW